MERIRFIGGFKQSRSIAMNDQRTVNLYPELDSTGKSVAALYGTPGLLLFATCGAGPVRGKWALGNFDYVVSGSSLYRVDVAGTATVLGLLTTATGPVSMSDNGTQVMILDGANGYIYNTSTSRFNQITDASFLGGRFVTFQDGYFIVGPNGLQSFQISQLYEGLTGWDSTDSAPAESLPDALLTVLSNNRQLWAVGEKTAEVYWNSGNSDFPFERIQGGTIEYGTCAAASVAKTDSSCFWISRTKSGQGQVIRTAGFQPQIISSRALEYELSTYSTLTDAIGWTYQQEGHDFYVLTFPTALKTWVYDLSIKDPELAWHERESYGLGRHIANCHGFFNGKHYVGDYRNGNIYEWKTTTYLDDTLPIVRYRQGRYISKDGLWLFHDRFEIDIQHGVGLATGQGSDPQVWLEYKDEEANNWSNKLFRTMGAIGKYGTRTQWDALGTDKGRGRIYRVGVSDPVPVVMIEGWCNITVGV